MRNSCVYKLHGAGTFFTAESLFNYQNNTYQHVQSFVGCNITHATPRDASVGSRDSRDSSFKFQYATLIKLLIRWLPGNLYLSWPKLLNTF